MFSSVMKISKLYNLELSPKYTPPPKTPHSKQGLTKLQWVTPEIITSIRDCLTLISVFLLYQVVKRYVFFRILFIKYNMKHLPFTPASPQNVLTFLIYLRYQSQEAKLKISDILLST